MEDRSITCTSEALEILKDQLNGQTLVIRASVEGGAYAYDFESVEPEAVAAAVEVVYDDPVRIVVELSSRRHLYGAEVAARDGGLVVKNPNKPSPVQDERLCNDDETAEQVARLLGLYINPELAAHGGMAWMIGHENRRAHIVMGGGCSGCGMADETMFGGIERIITARVDGIDEVVDDTNHAAGENPYYRPLASRSVP